MTEPRTSQPIDRIIFRASYLSGGLDFNDGGRFAPGVLITQDYQRVFGQLAVGQLFRTDLPMNTTAVDYDASDDDPSNCVPVNVHFADGTLWQNPDVGPTEPPMPTAPPTLPPATS